MNKMKEIVNNLKTKLTPKFLVLDSKFEKFMPNSKLRKIAYIAIGSLFGFMFLIIILGLLLSPLRNQPIDDGIILNKPNVIVSSPKPEVPLSDTEKLILNLETRIKEMRFPESILNIPVIEMDITI
jgi:hypothetical protein